MDPVPNCRRAHALRLPKVSVVDPGRVERGAVLVWVILKVREELPELCRHMLARNFVASPPSCIPARKGPF